MLVPTADSINWIGREIGLAIGGTPDMKGIVMTTVVKSNWKNRIVNTPMHVTTSIGSYATLEMKLLPAGEFLMGSSESDRELELYLRSGENNQELSFRPQRLVRITRPFCIGVYPVTQLEWELVMGSNPSFFSSGGGTSDRVSGMRTDDSPVENVSWDDAQEFIRRLNEQLGEAGWFYRLPTEAEWEYACRAGTTTPYYFGDDWTKLDEYGWCRSGSRQQTHRVGQKRPNAWGLYDMLGNVWEWCSDWYREEYYYYMNLPVDDPQGPGTASNAALLRVKRGGSWRCPHPTMFFSSDSNWGEQQCRDETRGFRLAMTVSSPQVGSRR